MPRNTNYFSEAVEKAAIDDQKRRVWPVYDAFEVRGEGRDLHVYAPAGESERDRKRMYAPLRDEPDLFLRFVELGRKGSISAVEMLDLMLDWVKTYGVLGLEDAEGRKQSLQGFVEEANKAAECLAMHTAYAAPEHERGAAIKEVQDQYSPNRTPMQMPRAHDELRTLFNFMHPLDQILGEQCYPALYRLSAKLGGEPSGFVQGWGFRSLLGAMYLQMMWLATHKAPRCKHPGCNNPLRIGEVEERHVYPASKKDQRKKKYRNRKDKEFCSKNCGENHRYHKRAGHQGYA